MKQIKDNGKKAELMDVGLNKQGWKIEGKGGMRDKGRWENREG